MALQTLEKSWEKKTGNTWFCSLGRSQFKYSGGIVLRISWEGTFFIGLSGGRVWTETTLWGGLGWNFYTNIPDSLDIWMSGTGVKPSFKHPRLFGYNGACWSLAASRRHGTMWAGEKLGVVRLILSERCGWRGIWLTVILETLGICFLRQLRRQIARRKKNRLLLSALWMGLIIAGWLTARKNRT